MEIFEHRTPSPAIPRASLPRVVSLEAARQERYIAEITAQQVGMRVCARLARIRERLEQGARGRFPLDVVASSVARQSAALHEDIEDHRASYELAVQLGLAPCVAAVGVMPPASPGAA